MARTSGLDLGSTVAARRAHGLLRDVLGGAVLLAVWLFLWGWFVVAVVPPVARAQQELARQGAAHERA
jgi:hypothetical protein